MTKAFRYSTVRGYFLQDEPTTKENKEFFYSEVNFGLNFIRGVRLDPSCESTHWQQFEDEVSRLNETSSSEVQYKVLYIARHGQGVHNVAEERKGRDEWNAKWAKLEGDGELTWFDAELTDTGKQQALAAHELWKKQVQERNMSLPQTFYTSPLRRALKTTEITFSGLSDWSGKPPMVKESLRELHGLHTCDRRSSKSVIHAKVPYFRIEDGFTEEDELWSPTVRESQSAVDARMKLLLDDVFSHDNNTFISFTTHALAIQSLLRVVGHRTFHIVTGSTITVLVKAEAV